MCCGSSLYVCLCVSLLFFDVSILYAYVGLIIGRNFISFVILMGFDDFPMCVCMH